MSKGHDVPEDGIRVRMYRMGLGDCFLLSWMVGDESKHMLIDFGVYQNASDASDKIKQVRTNILQTCSGKLDYLVLTHEHWDHLSGFEDKDFLERLAPRQVWMAWTEDPNNPNALALQSSRRGLYKAIGQSLRRMPRGSPLKTLFSQRVSQLLEFDHAHHAGLSQGQNSMPRSNLIMQRLKKFPTEFLIPGQYKQLASIPRLKVTVLGPPLEEAYIKSTDSRKQGVLYPKSTGLTLGFLAALDSVSSNSSDAIHRPFDSSYCSTNWKKQTFFKKRYINGKKWQQIEQDWLDQTHDLALLLNGITNNTSLVLAFELGDGGPVLLFAGDAQVGNWRSWSEVKVNGKPLDLEDLLRRTVLYKVSHHGSHNGTLKGEGLERMTHPDLVALLPTDRDFALNKNWHMLVRALEQALNERTRNRVISADRDLPKAAWPRLPRMSKEKLFVDYIVLPGQ